MINTYTATLISLHFFTSVSIC